MDTDVLTIREVAEYLKLTDKTTYRLVADGTIPGFKVGAAWRFRKGDIDLWIAQKLQKGKSGTNNLDEDNR